MKLSHRPLAFLVMGFVWVLLACVIGLALCLGCRMTMPKHVESLHGMPDS